MKILLTGANGQLGKACQKIFQGHELIPLTHADLDVTDQAACTRVIQQHTPDVILHTAAMTNVKLAQTEPTKAYATNTIGTYHLASAIDPQTTKFIYLSTDFVFDGQTTQPYLETDIPNPIVNYGRSKLAGEYIVQDLCQDYLIVRTAWVFGDGKNFIKTILSLAETKSTLPVVSDQIGTPTFTEDLAVWIQKLIDNDQQGTFHAVNDGQTTWAELAANALRIKNMSTTIEKITSAQYAQMFNDPTPRPKYSALDNTKLKQIVGDIRTWEAALVEYLG